MILRFVFVAEPHVDNLDRTILGWQIVHYVGDDRLVGEERFRTEAAAKAWAHRLNRMAEPLPAVRTQAEGQEIDPIWWDFDTARWDCLYPEIPF
jgi:hypothetical protein